MPYYCENIMLLSETLWQYFILILIFTLNSIIPTEEKVNTVFVRKKYIYIYILLTKFLSLPKRKKKSSCSESWPSCMYIISFSNIVWLLANVTSGRFFKWVEKESQNADWSKDGWQILIFEVVGSIHVKKIYFCVKT